MDTLKMAHFCIKTQFFSNSEYFLVVPPGRILVIGKLNITELVKLMYNVSFLPKG